MIVHQIWLQGWKYAPSYIINRVNKNKSLWNAPVWLWDESRIIHLLETEYPTYLSWFLSLQRVIWKCDVARAFILHHYGGVYADCDFDPNPVTIQYFYEEAKSKVTFIGSPWYGCNNFLIASPPKHVFWLEKYIPFIQESILHPTWFDFFMRLYSSTWIVLATSGPIAINRLIKQNPTLVQHTLTENEYAYGSHGQKESTWYLFKYHRLQQIIFSIMFFFALYGIIHFLKKNII